MSASKTEVVVINCGSSSLKFAWIESQHGELLATGLAERLGSPEARWKLTCKGAEHSEALAGADHARTLERMVSLCWPGAEPRGLLAVGHRIVHGGPRFHEPVVIDDDVLRGIEGCVDLAPLHNPANLTGIAIARRHFPDLPNVAVFDTSFHHTLPEPAYVYGVPHEWREQHAARRYGFHGTSYEFVSGETARRLGRPAEDLQLIMAHLGNGASVCAMRGGRSVDTSMGLTPLEGLVMGTRSGDVDPNLTEYIARKTGRPITEIIDILNRHSGLAGVSGLGNDMRTLIEAAAGGAARAQLAIDLFCYRLARWILAVAAGLSRIDALVFTAGIGEHSAEIRAEALANLAILGPQLDSARNAAHGKQSGGVITREGAPGLVAMVVPTNEEWMIARHAARLCGQPAAPGNARAK